MTQGNGEFRIALTGGGTAGHVWPHLAVIHPETPLGKLEADKNLKVFYVGSHEGMEKELITQKCPHWEYHSVATGKLRRHISLKNLIDPFKVILGVIQAFFLLGKVKPHVVFSKGGFVSAPVVWAAWLRGIPAVIHESDITPALTTKLTVPFARKILVAFSVTKDFISKPFQSRSEIVGLPLRASLFSGTREEGIKHFDLNPEFKTILIFGGSLGAKALNERIAPGLKSISQKYNIIHIVGKGKSFSVEAESTYKQFEFLHDDMSLAYACADVLLCRSGASTLFEGAALEKPMILIPLGLNQSRGDQILNAQYFTREGLATTIPETQLTPEKFQSELESILTKADSIKAGLAKLEAKKSAAVVSQLLLEEMSRYRKALED